MAKVPLSPEVEADVKRRANVFGIVLGLVCIPTAFLGGMIGACCPMGSFIGVVPVAFWAGWAGFLAAMFLDWGRIGHEQAIEVGARVGLRTGLISSMIGAGSTFLVATLFAGAVGGTGAAIGAAEGQQGAGAGGAAFFGASVLLNLVVAVLSLIPGAVFGTIGGVFGAAIKRK